jgi:ketosteroid isomerase-like protein
VARSLAEFAVIVHRRRMFTRLINRLLILLMVGLSFRAQAGNESPAPKITAKSGELFETIARMDKTIFDAFNAHDPDLVMALFTDDLEFYHDTGGLSDWRQNAEAFKKMFASTPDIHRDLVKGSLEVYPVKDYGAMEIGQHRFCHRENGKNECGTFKFAMIWRKNGDSWKISRVISYGH